jgi:ESS family glutamate:Na+ symporter
MISVTMDGVETFGAACFALACGLFLSKRISFFHRYNLPSSVIGGLSICILLLLLRKVGIAEVGFTKSFAEPLMYTFFASIGFAASLDTLKKGGVATFVFLLACSAFTILQNVLGVGVALVFDLHPLFGVLTGSVALAGGPGTALAFAKDFKAVGVQGAEIAALSAALSGIMIGGISGTPLATRLIHKFRLSDDISKNRKKDGGVSLVKSVEVNDEGALVYEDLASELLRHVIVLGLVLWAGVYASRWLEMSGIKLPGYIGVMVIAALVRNIGDSVREVRVRMSIIDDIGSVALALFLSMSLVSMEIWKIAEVALPLIVILVLQSLVVMSGAYWIIFRLSGRNYDAAVTSAGFVGFMMGTTANALTNMRAIVDRYGPSPKAFLVVPIVGACFIDFVNATIINLFFNYLK